jgi:hypothetical protein
MIVSIAAAALAAQLSTKPEAAVAPVSPQTVQYNVRPYPPPCGHGWDLAARDGLCYPNGYLPPQEQASRQYQRYYRGGRYPVPCGDGADLDSRDGRCYPNGTVPPQFQEGRQRYYGDGYYRRPARDRYYYRD